MDTSCGVPLPASDRAGVWGGAPRKQVTRVVSGAVLIAIAVGVVWFAPPVVFVAVAEILLVLAFIEYSRLAAACGVPIPAGPAGVATVLASISMLSYVPNDVVTVFEGRIVGG